MSRTRDQAFQEDDAAAERPLRLQARALVGLGELLVAADDPDAPATTARGRLQHQRVTDLDRRRLGRVQALHGPAAPRRHRHADLLGDQLRADLVTQLAHRVGARTDEGDTDLFAELGERRVLGNEAPPDPGRVRARLEQRTLEHAVVQVRARRRRPEAVAVVRFADESGGALGVGIERDRLDRWGPGSGDGPDSGDGRGAGPGGLSAVDDGDTAKHRASLPNVRPQQNSGPRYGRGSLSRTFAATARNGNRWISHLAMTNVVNTRHLSLSASQRALEASSGGGQATTEGVTPSRSDHTRLLGRGRQPSTEHASMAR